MIEIEYASYTLKFPLHFKPPSSAKYGPLEFAHTDMEIQQYGVFHK